MTEVNDTAYTLRLPDVRKSDDGRFVKGTRPWNKGKTWAEQGIVGEERARRLDILRQNAHKNGYGHDPAKSKPVIQYDDYGYKLHWYVSSDAAARKIAKDGQNTRSLGRNIRRACDKGMHAYGFRWRWDENFV